MKKWLLAAGALLVAIGFSILGRPERQLKKVQKQHDNLIVDGSKRAEAKAVAAGKKADKLQAEAKVAAEKGQAVIDNVGKNNETMRNLLDSWRKPDGL